MALTVAHIVTHRLSDSVFTLIPKLGGILKILCDIPDIVSNHPRRIANFFEEAFWLFCALLEGYSENRAGKNSKAEKLECTHLYLHQGVKMCLAFDSQQHSIYVTINAYLCVSQAYRVSVMDNPSQIVGLRGPTAHLA